MPESDIDYEFTYRTPAGVARAIKGTFTTEHQHASTAQLRALVFNHLATIVAMDFGECERELHKWPPPRKADAWAPPL